MVFVEPTSPLPIEHDRCARGVHPATGACHNCGRQLIARRCPGRVRCSLTRSPPTPPPTLCVIARVELSEQPGLRLAANIVDCEPDSVTSGIPVAIRTEKGSGGAALFAPAVRWSPLAGGDQ